MSKRLYALILCAVVLLCLSSCSSTKNDESSLTKGREFESWRTLYAQPFALAFEPYPGLELDLDGYSPGDAYLDSNLFYYAYYTLLAEGAQLEAVYEEHENREGDPIDTLAYHLLPSEIMLGTMSRLFGLTAEQLSGLPVEESPFDPEIGGYVMYPPYGFDQESPGLGYSGDVSLEEVRIERAALPATATLVLKKPDSRVSQAVLTTTVSYKETEAGWVLDKAQTNWESNDLVNVTGGETLDHLGGLSPADVMARLSSSVTTPDGILLLLRNSAIEGYDLIHMTSGGKALATGQLPGTYTESNRLSVNLYDERLIVCSGSSAFVGDLSLERFVKYELTYWSWGGEAESAVMLPDLTTWYYTGRDGIYQYNSATGEHFPFATHPSPIREDDNGMSAQIYSGLSLTQGGNKLIAAVVGYEWISDIHVFDLTPGSIVTTQALDRGWGSAGIGHAADDFFVYFGAPSQTEQGSVASPALGAYRYADALHTTISASSKALNSRGILALAADYSGGSVAVLIPEDIDEPAKVSYSICRLSLPSGQITSAASVTAATPRVIGVFPGGRILAAYDDYGHSGFIIA